MWELIRRDNHGNWPPYRTVGLFKGIGTVRWGWFGGLKWEKDGCVGGFGAWGTRGCQVDWAEAMDGT